MENTYCLKAWHHKYCLWKAEQTTVAIFPHLLRELCRTVPLVPPACVNTISPPTTQTKYVFVTAQLMGINQKGPGPSPLVMPVECASFLHTPLKLIHCNSLLMLQSQHTIHFAHRLPPDPDPSSPSPVMVTFTQTADRMPVVSISVTQGHTWNF
eukprot:11216723-Ditylum_brightwellii.AAC.1